ncbi:hypothetical protein [Holospora obtusa]|uniref:hypothetical protein n=1 Tax=Holospora obtusa TaxID=49893 RepID=UPI0003AEB637|nr:hypothetical protein [Holospora obtusa]
MVYGSIKLWCALTTPKIFNHYQKNTAIYSSGKNSQRELYLLKTIGLLVKLLKF